jgi:hypothetical protein
MSDKQIKLLPLGGWHIGDSSDRFELTKKTFDSVDTVFIENIAGNESINAKIINFFKAPLILPVVWLVTYLMNKLANLTGKGDGKLKEDIIEEYDAEVVEIDKSLHPTISASARYWLLSNYAPLFGVYILLRGNLIIAIMFFALVEVSMFIFYLAVTLYGRDSKMALDIEQHAQSHSGNACAIVGKHHEKGIIDKLANSSNVQIVSQDN